MSGLRLLIIAPWWRDPLVQDWTGCRSPWRYTVVEDVRTTLLRLGGVTGQSYAEEGHRVLRPVARRWTWRGAAKAREASRGE